MTWCIRLLRALLLVLVLLCSAPVVCQGGLRALFSVPDYIPVPAGVDLVLGGEDWFIVAGNEMDLTFTVTFSYTISPNTSLAHVEFSITEYTLPLSKSVKTYVKILVSRDLPPGDYKITLTVTFRGEEGGNTIIQSFEKTVTLSVSGRPLVLRVILKQPDGSSAYGVIKVAYKRGDSWVFIFEEYGASVLFYVREGTYKVIGIVGSRQKEEIVNVNENTTVELIISSIYIAGISIMKTPKSHDDPLLLSTLIVCEDPLVYQKTVDVVASISIGNLSEEFWVARLTLKGVESHNITIPIKPSRGWVNGTHLIAIRLYSGKSLLSEKEIQMSIAIFAPTIVQKKGLPLSLVPAISAISGAVGGLAVYLLLGGKQRRGIVEPKVTLEPKYVGIHCQGLRVLYNPKIDTFWRHFPDEISLFMVALTLAVGMGFEVVWKEHPTEPITLTLGRNVFVFYPMIREIQLALLFIYDASSFRLTDELKARMKKLADELTLKLKSLGVDDCVAIDVLIEGVEKALREAYKSSFTA